MTTDAAHGEVLNVPLARRRRGAGRVVVNRSSVESNRGLVDDDRLIKRVAGGDDAALRELLFRHGPWLAARLRALMPAADVEDVLQETFLAVWRGAGGYQPQGAPGGWLWGIARRQAALLLRRRGPSTAALTESETAAGESSGDPAEIAQWQADVEAAVSSLGSPGGQERELFRLLYEEDRPIAEVALLLGVPPGTVKSRAHRVRRLLRAGLGDHLGRGGSRE
jgi:RNA polymerase sigma-70 factor (ECF subfamily)